MIYQDRFQKINKYQTYEELFKDPDFQKAFGNVREKELVPVFKFLEGNVKLSNANILDLGAGYGSISVPISFKSNFVISADILEYSLRSIKYLAREKNIKNISTLRVDAFNNIYLPLKSESIDLVIVNGMLEYAGYAKFLKPREVQIRILKEIHRVLKPGGKLYLAMENRFAINYFLFGRGHDGLYFSSLLPRWLARCYSKIFKDDDYRIYEFSYFGLKNALVRAGFHKNIFFCGVRSYNRPKEVISLEDKERLREYGLKFIKRKISRIGLRVILSFNLQKFFWPHFIVLSEK